MHFEQITNRLTFLSSKDSGTPSYWWTKTEEFIELYLQGNAEHVYNEYLLIVQKVITEWDVYVNRGIQHLQNMLKPDYGYYCYAACFHDYTYGITNAKIYNGGFELFYWQAQPVDDRYVNYAVQFGKNGYDIGLRIFSA